MRRLDRALAGQPGDAPGSGGSDIGSTPVSSATPAGASETGIGDMEASPFWPLVRMANDSAAVSHRTAAASGVALPRSGWASGKGA